MGLKLVDRFILKTEYFIYEKDRQTFCLAVHEQFDNKKFYTLSLAKSKTFIYKGYDKDYCMRILEGK